MRMRKLSVWATPLVIGAFLLMATTGLLMFFHLESGLNKQAHEWLGWAMIAGALAHIALNWMAFKRYITKSNMSRAIIGVFVLLLAASFLSPPAGMGEEKSPPVLAFDAILNAPISMVAPLAGKCEAQLLEELQAAGFAVAQADQTLASVTGPERKVQGKAMRVVFSAAD